MEVTFNYLFSDVFFKVLVCCDVQADTAILEPLRLDFVISVWHGRNDNVGMGETFLECEG